ncbi:MAG: DUF2312 domain-containing protein [Asticcacaulis sp.]
MVILFIEDSANYWPEFTGLGHREVDKAAVTGDLKDVYAEAKGEGFDTKVMKRVVSLRRKDKVKVAEEDTLLDLYLSAIGGL